MRILALDLSTRRGSIAWRERKVTKREWPNDRRTSAPFFTALNEIVRAHGAPEMIVVGLGPGSYTGTRIAISAAIGLRLTTGANLVGLPSICALSEEANYAVIGDAKRSSFFFAEIQDHALAKDLRLFSEVELTHQLSEISVPVFTSDDLPSFNGAKLCFPSAERLCALAEEFPQNLVRAPLTPIYLREPHITEPRARKK